MKLISRLVSLATILSFLGLTALNGCKDKTSELVFSLSATDAEEIREFSFGNVPVLTSSSRTVYLHNTSGYPAEIRLIDKAAVEAGGVFKVVSPDASVPTCADGMTIAEDEVCAIGIEFSPLLIQYFEVRLSLTFFRPDANTKKQGKTETASLVIGGNASLDCNLHPDLAAARASGVEKAKDVNAKNTAQGKADGEALTYEDGFSDGYAQGYQNGYNSGYNGSEGYPKGYDIGYASGVDTGYADPAACSQGKTDGFLTGYNHGIDDGDYDGYNDGYDDGFAHGLSTGYFDGYDYGYITGYDSGLANAQTDAYNDGYDVGWEQGDADGYTDGYNDGADSCSLSTRVQGGVLPGPNEPIDPYYTDACYQQGYDATFDPNAYSNAFNKAKAENVNYQSGLSEGKSQGTSDGKVDGIEDGYKDGLAQGKADGIAVGKAAAYDDCYDANYPLGYYDGYNYGYDLAYDDGYDDGDDDGYDDSYSSGYADGEDDGYSDGYSDANTSDDYDDGWYAGYDNGYYPAYDEGFDAGYDDYCGTSAVRTNSLLKSFQDKKRNRAPKALQTVAKPTFGKRYGEGKKWWIAANESVPGHAKKADKDQLTDELKQLLKESSLTSDIRSTDEDSQRTLKRESLRRKHIKFRTPTPRPPKKVEVGQGQIENATTMDAERLKKFELRLKARKARR